MVLDRRREARVEAEIQRLTRALVQAVSPARIVLFGSWAWGSPRDWSDIDLLVVLNTSTDYWDRQAEIRRLVEAREPVDFLVLTPGEVDVRMAMGDPFFREIFERGRVLHAA